MATISVPVLAITNLTNTTVKLTVSYTLTPSQIEKLVGTVFSEDIRAIGHDLGNVGDIVISTFPVQVYAVAGNTTTIQRTRTRDLLKSQLNEDARFVASGAEQNDEVYARVTLTYAANAPTNPTLPLPTISNEVAGAWK